MVECDNCECEATGAIVAHIDGEIVETVRCDECQDVASNPTCEVCNPPEPEPDETPSDGQQNDTRRSTPPMRASFVSPPPPL